MKKSRLFYQITINTWKTNLAYKFNMFLEILGEIFNFFAEIYIWKAIFSQDGFQEMCTYFWIKKCATSLSKNIIIYKVNQKIRLGHIELDINRPFSFFNMLIMESLAYSIFQFIIYTCPVIFIEMLFFKIIIPQCIYCIFSVIFICLGIFLKIFICLCFSSISFYVFEIGILNRLLEDLSTLFSGSFIPLWLFKKIKILYFISFILPFKFFAYVPSAIFLKKYSYSQIIILFFQLIVYILIFGLLSLFLWNKAIKNLSVNGG